MFDTKKNYGILGLARSGIAAAYKIKELGGNAFLSEFKSDSEIPTSNQLKNDFECEFGKHSEKLFACDEWIVSPGIPLTAEIIQEGNKRNIKMISELEFGYQIKFPDSQIIAVTGSNGKSTTASLIAHIIKKSGKNSILAGNIGDAICGFPIEKPGIDVIVLEVSSFQLDLIDTFKPTIGVILNITPDHLNRYDSFKDYALSKMNIFKNQTKKEHAIINMDDVVIEGLENLVPAQKHYFTLETINKFREIPDVWLNNCFLEYNNGDSKYSVYDMQLKGPHNWANAMASVLACSLTGVSDSDIFSGLTDFPALKHRLQFVNSVKGISFYNDSKATNTDSVKCALLSFEQPIRLIMGGSDKGEDFSVLTDLLSTKAKKVYVTGDTAVKMHQTWFGKVSIVLIEDFETCVRQAFSESEVGDNIVLSPACASFDKFKNYEHRGDFFMTIVNTIAKENEEEK